MSEEDKSSKTEEPTEKKLRDARKAVLDPTLDRVDLDVDEDSRQFGHSRFECDMPL